MYALRRFSTLLKTIYEDRIADRSKRLKHGRGGHRNHHVNERVKVRQNVSKRLKARQMCVDDDDECNLEKTSLIDFTGHPIMHRSPTTNQGLRSRTSNATTDFQLVFNFDRRAQLPYLRTWYNGLYTKMAKPIRALELHYPMIQFLIIDIISYCKECRK